MKNLALIIEDEKAIIEYISFLLKKIDCDSVWATNIFDAKKILKKTKNINLIVADFYIKKEKITDLFFFLRKNKLLHIPTIIITGYDVEIKGLASGANIVLQKPIDEIVFLTICKNFINLQKSLKEYYGFSEISRILINAIDARDKYTKGHSERVAKLSVKIFNELRKMGISITHESHQLRRKYLYLGALFHDVGKIGIPDSILNSEKKLSEEEYDIIKKHPVIGYEICKNSELLKPSLDIILNHHERLDGTGYPEGKKAKDISFATKIVQVADIYDAISTDRPYRKKFNNKIEIIDEINKDVENGKIDYFLVEILKNKILNI